MEIGLSGFIKFVNSAPRSQQRIAREIAEQARSEYDPATDFWRPVRQAIRRDRKTTRDGEALRQTALSAPARRQASFAEISERWGDFAPRWERSHHAVSPVGRVLIGGLTVRVNPLFSEEWTDGHGESAHVWFNKEQLRPDTVQAVQHLLTRDGHAPNVEPMFIDMRRAFAVPASALDGVDDWLDGIGRDFLRLAA